MPSVPWKIILFSRGQTAQCQEARTPGSISLQQRDLAIVACTL